MEHVQPLHLGLGGGPIATERRIHGKVDPLVEGPLAGLFGFPDVDVAQLAAGLANTQVQQLTSQRFGSQFGEDLAVKVFPDRDVLDEGVDHDGDLLYIDPKEYRMNRATVLLVNDDVKQDPGRKRGYHSPRRAEQAAATRRQVLSAARDLFIANGYAATTVADIAAQARVSIDTVYASVGRKPALLRELVETAISGTGQAVPAEDRDYVARIRTATSAHDKLATYAVAITEIQQRMAPIFLALRDAAATDVDCEALWTEISRRRAANMGLFAADLRGTDQLRQDLTNQQVADIIWSMNAAEYWVLLVHERGWTPDQFTDWLTDAWTRLLLDPGHSHPRERTN